MEVFDLLMQGFQVAMQPKNLLWCLVGVTFGTAVGVLPGIGPAVAIALLLPITSKLDPSGALIMFAGIYYGAMYGGSTTSILLNTPGESATIVTAMEGNQMAQAGTGGAGALHGGRGFLRRRHHRDRAADIAGAAGGGHRHQVRAAGIFRADDSGLCHRLRRAG